MTKGFAAVATRMEVARWDFAQTLVELSGISYADACKVCDYYLKAKLAKMDAVMGRITVKHGAYLDRENIIAYRNAL